MQQDGDPQPAFLITSHDQLFIALYTSPSKTGPNDDCLGRLVGSISQGLVGVLSTVDVDNHEAKHNLGQHIENGVADDLHSKDASEQFIIQKIVCANHPSSPLLMLPVLWQSNYGSDVLVEGDANPHLRIYSLDACTLAASLHNMVQAVQLRQPR